MKNFNSVRKKINIAIFNGRKQKFVSQNKVKFIFMISKNYIKLYTIEYKKNLTLINMNAEKLLFFTFSYLSVEKVFLGGSNFRNGDFDGFPRFEVP